MDRIRLGKKLLLQPIPDDLDGLPYDDADALRRARNVVIISLGLFGACLLLLVSALLREATSYTIVALIAGVVASIVISLLALGGRVRLAALLLVMAPLLLVVLAVVNDGQLRSAPYFCSVSLVIAGMTMRPRGVTLACIGALAALAALGALSIGVAQVPPPTGSQLINSAILVGIVALIATLGAGSAAASLRALQLRERQTFQVEQALRASEERYRLIAQNTGDLIALFDTEGRFLYASPSYARELGVAPATLVGTHRYDLIHPEDNAAEMSLWQQARLHGSAQGIYRLARADGAWRWFEIRLTAVQEHGEHYIVLIARDITMRRALEARFQQAQKLEALGRLASGVAHDFNNLLVVINGSADLAAEALPDDHPARGDLEAIQQASRSAADLTRQLLAFARRQVVTPRLVDLGEVLRDASRMLERLIGEQIRLHMQIAPDVWPIWGDPGQLEQVLINMAVNARDAMPDGGTLTISIANTLHASSEYGSAPLIPYVRLTIADTGVGMSDEARRHLFEPFYTTKAPDMGTGLGLATCYGIVAQSGGDISVVSAIGAGTTFTILLPSASSQPDADAAAERPGTSNSDPPPPSITATPGDHSDWPYQRVNIAGLRGIDRESSSV